MGLPEEDFKSYATHRGDHLTAQRATFANPKLLNEMVKENGQVKQGSLARIEPEGKVTRMWEAIETYMERKQPLIIVAGADYRSEEHTSELQSLMRISYAVFCLKKKTNQNN